MSICVIFQTSYPAEAQSVPEQPVTSWDLGKSFFLWASPCYSVSIIKAWTLHELAPLSSFGTDSQTVQEDSTPGETVTTFENESPSPRSSERCNETPN